MDDISLNYRPLYNKNISIENFNQVDFKIAGSCNTLVSMKLVLPMKAASYKPACDRCPSKYRPMSSILPKLKRPTVVFELVPIDVPS